VGKSSLTNALVGQKVAITSERPQTTRHAVRGIVNRADAQLVLVDTPGLHRPRTLLGERLNDIVRTTWSEVDTVGLVLPADQKPGPGDRYLAEQLAGLRRTGVVLVMNKMDLVDKAAGAAVLAAAHSMCLAAGLTPTDVVPVSALSGDNIDVLGDVLVTGLPAGPPLYPEGVLTDEPEETLVAELIRESALAGVREELPHSIAVTVEEMEVRPDRPEGKPLLDVHATIHVERDSQKPIVIGKGGSRLKQIGADSRAKIQAMLGTPVYLHLHVRVAKEWQRDPKQLRRLGF
jgi:GTP-binding protein Era